MKLEEVRDACAAIHVATKPQKWASQLTNRHNNFDNCWSHLTILISAKGLNGFLLLDNNNPKKGLDPEITCSIWIYKL
jgi:hypothetical protein